MSAIGARDVIIYAALPAAGAVAGRIWSRLRRRLARLTWTALYQPMAFATEDLGWGRVQILYNGQPTQNLHIITVQVVNESDTDLAGVEFNVQASDGTIVLRSQAVIRGTLVPLPFGPAYAAVITEAGRRQLTPPELAVWGKRSDWHAPVLNRGAIVDIRLLVSRNDHLTPTVAVYSNHLGARLRHRPPAPQLLGVNQLHAALVGLVVAGSGAAVLAASGLATWLVAGSAFVLGAFGSVIGVGAIRFWRWLRKLAT